MKSITCAQRSGYTVEVQVPGVVTLRHLKDVVDLSADDARWLAAVALPAALAALPPEEVPSDACEKVDDGQIAGQTTIDEVLGLR